MADEVERTVQSQPGRNKPEAPLKADCSKGCKAGKEHDFWNEIAAAPSHHRKQDIERANDGQHGGIKRPVAIVANDMSKRHDTRGERRADAERDNVCIMAQLREYHCRAKTLQLSWPIAGGWQESSASGERLFLPDPQL